MTNKLLKKSNTVALFFHKFTCLKGSKLNRLPKDFIEQMSKTNVIQFYLFFNGHSSLSLTVKANTKIGKLSSLSPFKEPVFIHSGVIIQPATSLEFNKVSNGDVIIAVPKCETKSSRIDSYMYWTNFLKNSQEVASRIEASNNRYTSREVARIHDLELARLEGNTRVFDKFCRCLLNTPTATTTEPSITFYPNQNPLAPSKEALPALW